MPVVEESRQSRLQCAVHAEVKDAYLKTDNVLHAAEADGSLSHPRVRLVAAWDESIVLAALAMAEARSHAEHAAVLAGCRTKPPM